MLKSIWDRSFGTLEEWRKDLRSLGVSLMAFSIVGAAFKGGNMGGIFFVFALGVIAIFIGHARSKRFAETESREEV